MIVFLRVFMCTCPHLLTGELCRHMSCSHQWLDHILSESDPPQSRKQANLVCVSACVYKCINALCSRVCEFQYKLFLRVCVIRCLKFRIDREGCRLINSVDIFRIGLKKPEWAELHGSGMRNH